MRKCSNCSAPVADEDIFCPICGQPIEQQKQKQSKPKKQKKTRQKIRANKAVKTVFIISLVLFLLSGIVFGVVTAILNMPKYRFARAQIALLKGDGNGEGFTLEKLLKGEYDTADHMSTDGVLSADVPGLDINKALNGVSIDFGITRDGYDTTINASARYGSIPLLSAEAFMDEETIGLYAKKLSKKYYTADKALINETLTGIDNVPLSYMKMEDLAEAYSSVIKRYGKLLLKAIANSDVEIYKDSFSYSGLSGKKSECTVMTFTPNKQRMRSLMVDLGAELGKDEELSNYVLSLLERYYRRDLIDICAVELRDNGFATDNGLIPAFGSASEFLRKHSAQIAELLIGSKLKISIVLSNDKPIAEYIRFGDAEFSYEKSDTGVYFCINDPSATVPGIEMKFAESRGYYSGTVTFSLQDGRDYIRGTLDISRCLKDTRSAIGVPYGNYSLSVQTKGYELPEMIAADLAVFAADGGGSEHRLVIHNAGELFNNSELSDISIRMTTTDTESTAARTDMPLTKIHDKAELDDAVQDVTGALILLIKGLDWLL